MEEPEGIFGAGQRDFSERKGEEEKLKTSLERLKEITLLYCEDEAAVRETTRRFLSKFVREVLVAENGREGLERYREAADRIDLIVTDVSMPEMDGLVMTREIKSIDPDLPVIVTTAFSNSDYLLEAIDLNVDKYVLKPLQVDKLLGAMSQSLLYHELRGLYRDALTHLPSRNALLKRLDELDEGLLLQIDIRNFSEFNDLYGSQRGDRLLEAFSEVLRGFFPETFELYRLEGDRFAVLLPQCEGSEREEEKIESLFDEFSRKMELEGISLEELPVYLTLYGSLARGRGEELLNLASRALRCAKRGGDRFLRYREEESSSDGNYEETLTWVRRLKYPRQGEGIVFWFQPIVPLQKTSVPRKYEALVRYKEISGRIVPPSEFLEIARRGNLMGVILRRSLQEAVAFARPDRPVSVNISYREIASEALRGEILERLETAPHAEAIAFEILESEEIRDFEVVRGFIDRLRRYGCSVGIDDFGAGYSNFHLIAELKPDFVKIDGAIVAGIVDDPIKRSMVEAIHGFCRTLGIDTVVEAVETEEQVRWLSERGVQYAQGWYFAAAEPPEVWE